MVTNELKIRGDGPPAGASRGGKHPTRTMRQEAHIEEPPVTVAEDGTTEEEVECVCACCVLLRVVVGRGSSTRGRDQMTQTVKCIPSRLLCSILEFHLSGNSAFSISLRTVLLLIGLILGTIVLSSFLPFALSHMVFWLYLV